MPFELPALPYPKNALEPHVSAETLEYHHGKHHAKYVKTLNELIASTAFEKKSLEDIVRTAGPGKLFNQAAQHWNHSFYWKCMTPDGARDPKADLAKRLEQSFGSLDGFREKFSEAAIDEFGSGWAWLVLERDGSLAVENTTDAVNPVAQGKTALLTCDVWEHAYYIDYRHERPKYVEAFWKIVNWDFVAENLAATAKR
jgi:Fe-Mn family superoxide dismutase